MKYLLDTNALIFAIFTPSKLSETARLLIENPDNEIFVSIVSFWEIGIKQSIGKIDIAATIQEIEFACDELDIHILGLQAKYIDQMKELPFVHRDPFDRIIVAQSIVEDLGLITSDETIPKYKEVRTVW